MKKLFALMLAVTMLHGSAALAATPTDLDVEPSPVVSEEPTQAPSPEPTQAPSPEPTQAPTQEPTQAPVEVPVETPTEEPTATPTVVPTQAPTEEPTPMPEATEVPAPESTVAAPTDVPQVTAEPAVERSVEIRLITGNTVYAGDRVDLRAELTGYEQVTYSIQWQVWNKEKHAWEDIAGAVEEVLWLDVTEDMNGNQYQVLVNVA